MVPRSLSKPKSQPRLLGGLKTGAGLIEPDAWLSAVLGRPCWRLKTEGDWASRLRKGEPLHGLARGAFVTAKVAPHDVAGIAALEGAGFRLVDTQVRFGKAADPSGRAAGRCQTRFAEAGDEPGVIRIAARGFSLSRFHLDPAIGPALAGRVKAEWAKDFFAGKRGDRMVVAFTGGEVAGFAQLLSARPGEAVIDLIAVDPARRRKGIARDMIAFAERSIPGLKRISAGTQLANDASLRFYASLGFAFEEARHVFHFHA
jgi:ribosomal protein S18 acetylase RimI-like enzyme